ncbi:MAG: hypothetical protein U0936_13030 [Planctomycetaceae bacterium]
MLGAINYEGKDKEQLRMDVVDEQGIPWAARRRPDTGMLPLP